jgi:16S rRNA (adenine1518-N6/adenine1519-N6)-dimethyltransferase
MQTKREIQELLSAAGVAPNRTLGQRFLVDLNLMRLLVDAARIGPSDVVLEIGTGTGSLTEALAPPAGRVVTVELDSTLAEIAQSQLADARNVQIVNADVLSGKGTINPTVTEAVTEARARLKGIGPIEEPRVLLVSNLPYDVASPVMINLVKGPVTVDAMFVTVQKEVADRMTARPGSRDYGTLSIFLQATGAVEAIRRLKPSVFWPPPAVESAMVRYVRDRDRSRRIQDMDLFGAVIGLFIGHRRKMLRACIKEAPPELCGRACRGHPLGELGAGSARDSGAGRVSKRDTSRLGSPRPRHEDGRDLWPKIFELHAIDPTRRPEELSPQQYVDLANSCHQFMHARTQ